MTTFERGDFFCADLAALNKRQTVYGGRTALKQYVVIEGFVRDTAPPHRPQVRSLHVSVGSVPVPKPVAKDFARHVMFCTPVWSNGRRCIGGRWLAGACFGARTVNTEAPDRSSLSRAF